MAASPESDAGEVDAGLRRWAGPAGGRSAAGFVERLSSRPVVQVTAWRVPVDET